MQRSVTNATSERLTPRIQRAAQFVRLLEACPASRLASPDGVTAAYIPTLRQHFVLEDAEVVVDRADMLAATAHFLRGRFPSVERPLVALEAEALCLARRFEEAARLAESFPDVEVGHRNERLHDYVLRCSCEVEGQSRICESKRDYQRILKTWVL